MSADVGRPAVVTLQPDDGGRVVYRGGSYAGDLAVVARVGGLGLVERQTVDGYLSGIREVPFSWPDEALEAQAVAARTYLAWTLQRGRSSAGRTYGFDICASTRCQVYRGVGVAEGPNGDRWLAALGSTEGEILVHEGAPAQALYSASHGSLSRGVEEIWGGSGLPYLVRVSSPEIGVSPYDSWRIDMSTEIFAQVLRTGGVAVGAEIVSVTVTAEPGVVSSMRIESDSGVTTLPLTRVRAIINVHGPQLFPGVFPGERNDGRRLPQSVPSYSFGSELVGGSVERSEHDLLAPGEFPERGQVVFSGEGWGHGVGMSQWGAYAMAEGGADFSDILAHYYGGLGPQTAGPLLPAQVDVGLTWDQDTIEFDVVGMVRFLIDGRPAAVLDEGRWRASVVDGGVVLTAVAHEGTIYPQGRLLR